MPSVTCEACMRAGTRPPVGRAARRETLLGAGWVAWKGPEDVWVCPSCFTSRDVTELEELVGEPSSVTTSRARLYGPACNFAFSQDPEPGHHPSLAEFETAIAVEQAATRLDARSEETQPERDADAPTQRPRAISVSIKATPDAVARGLGFEVIGLAGRGGLGTVLEVKADGEVSALKIIHGAADDVNARERLRREIVVTQSLDHPHIVKIKRSFLDDGVPAFSMEFVPGLPLDKVIKGGALSLRRACEITEQVCQALAHAHAQGIVHRDIKPQNVLMDHAGQVKVTDFGIAKLAREMPGVFTLTETGDQVGTPAYMAPEQRGRAHEADHRADVYAVGVLLWAMVSGKRPRLEDGHVVLGPTVPRLDSIVERATAQNPADRYPSVELLARDVLAARLAL